MRKQAGVIETNDVTAIHAKIDALTRQLSKMQTSGMSSNQYQVASCELCGGIGHSSQACEVMNPFSLNGHASVNFVGDQGVNHFSNTYNPSWRDYPNMPCGGNQNHNQAKFNQRQPNYQTPPLNTQAPTNHPPYQNQYHQPQDNKPSMESFMETMMKQQKEMMEN